MITVINKRNATPSNGIVVYIGRGSPLGNPFPMKNNSIQERNRVCDEYEQWLNNHITSKTPSVCTELNRIYTLSKDNNIYLQCYCAPLRCHGDYIKKVINNKAK
jgi:hypothetical protein